MVDFSISGGNLVLHVPRGESQQGFMGVIVGDILRPPFDIGHCGSNNHDKL
jgi:hypothetical protein